MPLVLFAKAPRPGGVKTRLARTVGAETAARLAAALLEDTVRRFSAIPGVPLVLAGNAEDLQGFVDGGASVDRGGDLPALLAATFGADPGRGDHPRFDHSGRYHAQGHGSLGERLRRAFLEVPPRWGGRACGVLAIGADAPHLDPGRIAEAAAAVRAGCPVLGPANDGGYYLIGVPCGVFDLGALFPDAGWGEPGVLAHARSVLGHVPQVTAPKGVVPQAASGSLCELPPLSDIDAWGDLRALAALLVPARPGTDAESGASLPEGSAVDPALELPALVPLLEELDLLRSPTGDGATGD